MGPHRDPSPHTWAIVSGALVFAAGVIPASRTVAGAVEAVRTADPAEEVRTADPAEAVRTADPTEEPSSHPDAPDPPEFRVTIDEATAERVERLIAALSSPHFVERQGAKESLIDVGPGAFLALRDARNRTDDHEVRLLIEEVFQTAYMNDHLLDRNGFLGVRQGYRFLAHDDDPRIPRGGLGVTVDQVLPGLAADQHGLRSGDVITAVDGAPIPPTGLRSENSFAEQIRRRGAGTLVTLTVLRGQGQMELPVVLGRRPLDNYIPGDGDENISYEAIERAQRQFEAWWDRYFGEAREQPPGDPRG
jgi:hypothetical protein